MYIQVLKLLKRKAHRLRVGLVNCMNDRGLGTESRLLEALFAAHFPEVEFDVFRIPAGKAGKSFDQTWQNNCRFNRWLRDRQWVMTIELLMPNLFRACRNMGVKTIWRPNFEWILPEYAREDFDLADCIMTPQLACADFLERKFGLANVVRNPWVTQLPIHTKVPRPGPTTFLFNAGRGGIGNRRNHEVVAEAFSRVLPERDDIRFVFKTQVDLDVMALKPFAGRNFAYTRRNTSYSRNVNYYREADFSLAPSKWEGLGLALLESLYCGTPVLTVDAPPMNEWITHKVTGYVVPAHFPDVPLPIPYDRVNLQGLHWVRAALCDADDVVARIHWLADNKTAFYEQFNRVNPQQLGLRMQRFIATFREVLGLPG